MSRIAPFLSKLYEMTNNEACINWTEDGLGFYITNLDEFTRNVLPSYFKHNNLASFVRQLNLYGAKTRLLLIIMFCVEAVGRCISFICLYTVGVI